MANFDEYFKDYYASKKKSVFFEGCEFVLQNLKNDELFAKAYRVNSRSNQLIKKFREEALPIYRFLKCDPIGVISIALSDDTTNYDATITLADQSTRYIEATCAKDGELEQWENKILNERGGVPIAHGLNSKGLIEMYKSDRTIPHGATDDETEYKKLIPRIIACIKSKQEKDYPRSTYLLVAINYFFVDENALLKIAEEVKVSLKINEYKFLNVYLVSSFPPIVLSLTSSLDPKIPR